MTGLKETADRPIRVGIYNAVAAAEKAVESLQQAGFTEDEITVFSSTADEEQRFEEHQPEAETGAPVASATTGSVIGGAIGGLSAVATFATAGGIPILVTGGMAGMLTGGVVGGLAGAMLNRGLEKESADYFDQAVADGRTLVAVEPAEHSTQRLNTAARILEDAGVQPISLPEG